MRLFLFLAVAWCIGCVQPKPAPPCLRVTPSELDFGEVASFSPVTPPAPEHRRSLEIFNDSNLTRTVQSSVPPDSFTLHPQIDTTPSELLPGESLVVWVQFLPDDALVHEGSIEVSGGPDCIAAIALSGLGSGSFRFEPASLDFGFVEPGQEKTLEVRLVNSRRDVTLPVESLSIVEQPVGVFSTDLTPFELPPSTSRTFFVTARPPTDEKFIGRLDYIAPLGEYALRRIGLSVVGGAPKGEVSPTSIQVPIVGFSAGSMPASYSDRTVRLRNVSTTGRSPEARLGIVGQQLKLEALNGSPPAELKLVAYPFAGLQPGEEGEVLLRLTPTSVGPRSYRVTLVTNDPVQPELVLTYDANVEELPRCEYRVQPENELFLAATPDGGSSGAVSIVNQGSTRCVVDDVRLSAATPSAFRLVNGEAQLVVEAGQTAAITIDGPGPSASAGELVFHVFNANSVQRSITLRPPP